MTLSGYCWREAGRGLDLGQQEGRNRIAAGRQTLLTAITGANYACVVAKEVLRARGVRPGGLEALV